MGLSDPGVPRTQLHTRKIEVRGYAREDGLFDIEGFLVDTKTHDFPLRSGLRPAGEPIHDLGVRLTIDKQCHIHAAEAFSARTPYPGACDKIGPAYGQLVGLNLMHGFRKAVTQLFGTTKGCAHLTELLFSLPTGAIQTFAGLRKKEDTRRHKPFEIDGCHALAHDTETVRVYYPDWYRPKTEATVDIANSANPEN